MSPRTFSHEKNLHRIVTFSVHTTQILVCQCQGQGKLVNTLYIYNPSQSPPPPLELNLYQRLRLSHSIDLELEDQITDALMGFLSAFTACLQRLRGHGSRTGGASDDENDSSSLFFSLHALQVATDFFSDLNQLGHGGFGPVFKVCSSSYHF